MKFLPTGPKKGIVRQDAAEIKKINWERKTNSKDAAGLKGETSSFAKEMRGAGKGDELEGGEKAATRKDRGLFTEDEGQSIGLS